MRDKHRRTNRTVGTNQPTTTPTGQGLRSLTVITPVGDVSVAFGVNHHIAAVAAEVLTRLERDPELQTYSLVLVEGDEGTPLDHGDTLGSAGVADGAELVLESNPVAI
jgi:hypothetical protein